MAASDSSLDEERNPALYAARLARMEEALMESLKQQVETTDEVVAAMTTSF